MSAPTMKVLVKAVPEAGFNRCGRRWAHNETEADVSAEMAEILKAEPKLIVRDAPAPASPGPAKKS